ncbi:alpha/beta hydrolase [Streptomyces fumanus]|uniref:Alpha/beta hydrolase n=1 Tax=Streptomyces fumanus TaxID=67302 RepID=A0A919AIH4_9ACTN|nr:alpha/beta hydrolase [Streptomyces fumanus]GHF07864.1 alpha/beta hydrolase [Streptomyces fumanus]
MRRPARPAVVLAHGAFADASVWTAVTGLLTAGGLAVHAPDLHLRGLAQDAARLQDAVRRAGAPVVLVGHGYGGAVVTQAATGTDEVVALCYVAGFGLDAGECVLDVTGRFPAMPLLGSSLTADPAALGRDPAGRERELLLRAERFGPAYAADLPDAVRAALLARQRPITLGALTDTPGEPAWAGLPAWYAIAGADRLLNPTAQRFMAQRMAATEHVLDASHAVPLSRPAAVAAMIREATARATGDEDTHRPHR